MDFSSRLLHPLLLSFFKMNPEEDQFIIGLLELQYDSSVSLQLKPLAKNISWAEGWPDNNKAFWNAEAFMWQRKIDSNIRQLITNELQLLQGNNLDLGCGSYSYIPSTGFDFSEKMLDFNENLIKKVQGNLEEPLSFQDSCFDSITAIFVLNYVKDYQQLFSEIERILKSEGTFVMILSANPVKDWQRQKEVHTMSKDEWMNLLEQSGFSVTLKTIQNLLFFTSKIQKTY